MFLEHYDTNYYYRDYYYDLMERTGVSAVGWMDVRFRADWENKSSQVVDTLHSRGIAAVGTLSMISTFQERKEEPPELLEALLRDPYGNLVEDPHPLGGPETFPVHSTLDPAWQAYLLSTVKKQIDFGVDALNIDELAYGTNFYPDFNKYTVEEFKKYLLTTYSAEELDSLGSANGVEDFENFDYAALVRRHLPAEMTRLTKEDWAQLRWQIPIPLHQEFERFRRVKNKQDMARLISKAKAYAQERHGKDLAFSANLNDLHPRPALFVIDLLDYVDLEWFYYDRGYFPKARAFSTLKLAQALGKRGFLIASLSTRSDVVERGKEKTVSLYKTMIADGYGGGGAFYVEEGAHGVSLDMEAVGPYFRFAGGNPALLDDLTPIGGNIGILYLWEAMDGYEVRAYRGLSNLLADTGYQFDVVFGAEDVSLFDPAPAYPLELDNLLQYPVILVPELADIIEKHAGLLLQYVENGNKLVVFATDEMLQQIEWDRGEGESVRRLLRYLRASEATVGTGAILRIDQIWGTEYLENIDLGLRSQLLKMLSQEGINPQIKMSSNARALSAFAYAGEDRVVIHLVNYDYDLETDTTNAIQAVELAVNLGELPSENLTVTYYSPDAPQRHELEFSIHETTISLTIPEIDIRGVLLVST